MFIDRSPKIRLFKSNSTSFKSFSDSDGRESEINPFSILPLSGNFKISIKLCVNVNARADTAAQIIFLPLSADGSWPLIS